MNLGYADLKGQGYFTGVVVLEFNCKPGIRSPLDVVLVTDIVVGPFGKLDAADLHRHLWLDFQSGIVIVGFQTLNGDILIAGRRDGQLSVSGNHLIVGTHVRGTVHDYSGGGIDTTRVDTHTALVAF